VTTKFDKVLCGFFSEAKTVCGSEGLYQSIFYHHARCQFQQSQIRREEPAEGGKVDFVLEDTDRIYAVELKAGANGHRNSLANMKEVESKGKGLQHDLAKLHSLKRRSSRPVESWLVCVDLAALGIAFSSSDLEKYSSLSNRQETHFAYVSQLDDEFQTWVAGKRTAWKPETPQRTQQADPWHLIESEPLWRNFFAEVVRDNGPECSHVGLFYHALRRSGLIHKQVASEVFFNCSRYGTRQYYVPDFAVFEKEFVGHFQLYGNNRCTVENDQFKLPVLVSVLEFKGGNAFRAKSIAKRKEEIIADVEKLAQQIKPRIESAPSFLNRPKALAKPNYTMVVTDNDSRLESSIEALKAKHKGTVSIRWPSEA
jgi:hypothetical protein